MNYEEKRPLMERLDKCLLANAVDTGTKEGGPKIVDVYRLEGLSETHFYLKVKHEFTPDEVSALMDFADPLAVARECWEERTPEKGFPICELLQKINAYERFALADPAAHAQEQERMVTVLKAVLDQNMAEFHASLLDMGKEEIIAQSAEIAAMQEAYDFMKNDFKFDRSDADILLHMENPLKFIAEQWPSDIAGLFDMDNQIGEAIEDAGKTVAAEREQRQSTQTEAKSTTRGDKPSVRDQLRDNLRELGQRPHTDGKARDGEAR